MGLLDFLDRPIAFHRVFVSLAGNVTAGLMLSQAFYWSRRTLNDEGWFYKIQSEWEEETGLTRYEQEGARKALRSTKFWKEKRVGCPAKLFYRIDLDELERSLADLIKEKPHTEKTTQNPEWGKSADLIKEKPLTSTRKSHIQDQGNSKIQNGENQQVYIEQRLLTEITSETTTEKKEERFSENRSFVEKAEELGLEQPEILEQSQDDNSSLVNKAFLSEALNVTEAESSVQKFENNFKLNAQNPKHVYPQAKFLAKMGLPHLWVGPLQNDFAPELKAGVKAKKREWGQNTGDADVLTYINNKINRYKNGDLGQDADLLARYEEGCSLLVQTRSPKVIPIDDRQLIAAQRKEIEGLSTAQQFLPPDKQALVQRFKRQQLAFLEQTSTEYVQNHA